MAKFLLHDIKSIENVPISPAVLRSRIGEMISQSTVARAKVESLNPQTGEYRIVLQGTLEKDDTRREG